MLHFKLEIETGNEAMQSAEAVAHALEQVAYKLRSGIDAARVMDTNGNTVGKWSLLSEED